MTRAKIGVMKMMMNREQSKPKWRWLLLPLSPIAIVFGIIKGLISGFTARQSSPVLITGDENERTKP